jgi:hypothetical protein
VGDSHDQDVVVRKKVVVEHVGITFGPQPTELALIDCPLIRIGCNALNALYDGILKWLNKVSAFAGVPPNCGLVIAQG